MELDKNKSWETIRGFNNYLVSNFGDIYSKITNKIMKQKIDRYGYPVISITNNDGIKKYPPVHRLVASTFKFDSWSPTRNIVNHIDGVKTNNYVDNLEWCTNKENIDHSYEKLLNANTVPVILFDLVLKTRKRFNSVKSLSKFLNIKQNILIGLIKGSSCNPILGRYKVLMTDETDLNELSNVKNFGKKIYVFDHLDNTLKTFNSIRQLSLFYGLRNTKLPIFNIKLGLQINEDRKALKMDFQLDRKKLLTNRLDYVLAEYVPYIPGYDVLNYLTGVETYAESISDVKDITGQGHVLTQPEFIDGKPYPPIYRGFGVRSRLIKDLPWYPHNEERILMSIDGRTCGKYYRVHHNGFVKVVCGSKRLAEVFNYDVGSRYVSSENLIKTLTSIFPNSKIERLNKEMKHQL